MKGFSIIEVSTALALTLLLVTLGIGNFNSLQVKVTLDEAVYQLLTDISWVRSKGRAGEFDTSYGIHFETSRYILFKGSVYNANDPNNKIVTLNSAVEIDTISIVGGSDVVFNRLTGTTTNTGTIHIRDKKNINTNETIVFYPSGAAGVQGVVNQTGTRITDSRHLHFNLGWSIQGATTLRLFFPDAINGNVTYDIAMADYFNLAQTDLLWQGTVAVNGENQTLRVNTHQLDAFNTTLSIHRDRRLNTKALTISIISGGVEKDIVSYQVNGVATAGIFGGTMTVQ